MREHVHVRVVADVATETPRARVRSGTALFIPFCVALVLWVAFVFRVTYNFHTTVGRTISQGDLAYIGDVFTRLPRNLDFACFMLLFLLSAVGPGALVLRALRLDWRDETERLLFAVATGLIVFTFALLAVGSAGFLQRRVCFAMLALGLVLTAREALAMVGRVRAVRAVRHAETVSRTVVLPGNAARRRVSWRVLCVVGLTLALAFYLYIALLGAISPEFNYDARWYHLGSANSYAQHERFYNIIKDTRLAVVAVDPYQTALYAGLIKMDGLIAAKLLHWGDALLTAFVLIYFCRVHFRSVIMGLIAALVFISTPLVTWASTGGGNDLQMSLYILLGMHAFLRWRERPESVRWLIVLGITTGYALGSKLFGIYNVIILFAGVVVVALWTTRLHGTRAERLRRLAAYLLVIGMVIVVCCLPWLIRTYAMTGNPIFPLLNNVFESPYWNHYADESVHFAYSGLDRNQSLASLLTVPWHAITGNNRYRAIFGPLFFINMPICVALAFFRTARSRDIFRLLGVYLTAWVLLWFASGALELRYALSVMPVMAILVAFPIAVQQWSGWAGKLFQAGLALTLLVTTALNYQPLVTYQRMAILPTAYGHALIPWAYLYHGQPEEQVYLLDLPVIRYMNAHLSPATDKVYDLDGLILGDAYSDITVFNGGGYDGPYGMRQWSLYSADAIAHFRQEGITYVAVTKRWGLPLKRFSIWPYLQEVYRSPGDNDFLYRVNYDAPRTIAPGDPSIIDDFSFGEGWLPGTAESNGQTVYFMEQDSQIFVTMPQAQNVRIRFTATPVIKPLTLELRVNDVAVATVHLTTAGDPKEVSVDHVPLNAIANNLEIHAVEGCIRPSEVSNSTDMRCFSFTVQDIKITAEP